MSLEGPFHREIVRAWSFLPAISQIVAAFTETQTTYAEFRNTLRWGVRAF
jgi:hypothetical protein